MFANLNGTRLYFDVEGSGYVPAGERMKHRPVLIAVHGGPGSDHSDFKPWLTPLADHMQIIYLDQRCNGQSERVDPATCSMEQLADDIEALRLYLGLGRIHLLGHSFGGMVAQVFATRYPDSLDKLLLVNTAPSKEFYPDALEFAKRIAAPEQLAAIPELFEGRITDEESLIRWWDINYSLYFYRHDEKLMLETGNRPIGCLEIANYTFKHFMPHYDVRPLLPSVRTATLIVAARHDWITPVSQAEEMHRLLPNAQLALFEESGHMPFIEEQEAFIERVLAFVSADEERETR
ncbi:alpha/beta fold hydrolase [Cohnella lubricantis]|uniref:Alpha/beta fold hydrolase n=1 Tax=Cohnella lubricantis TaxID=2163172 RepID=A0A841TJS3_9BACL|nr:alpha/beta fold hydrolase [Cohnella lubricantis]MBB6679450.1 alpha/beta fold hydrolase [Cohnella lubricantis]MBP2118187.1 proline iminopeptidase [Cohnella lubricantis]